MKERVSQCEKLEQALKSGKQEQEETIKACELREKMHHDQMSKIRDEKQSIKCDIEKLKKRMKQLEDVIRLKKNEMDSLDNKLKDLVQARSVHKNYGN